MTITKKLLTFLLLNVAVGTNSYSDIIPVEPPSVICQKDEVFPKKLTTQESNIKRENQLKKRSKPKKARRTFKRIIKKTAIGIAVFAGTIAIAVFGAHIWALSVGL